MMTKEDRQFTMFKVIRWLNKSDKYVSREMIARYAGLTSEDVADCFKWLESEKVKAVEYKKSSDGRAIYEQNKHLIRCMAENVQLD